MKKTAIFLVFLVLISIENTVFPKMAPVKDWDEGGFLNETNENKGNKEREKQIYYEYILGYFSRMQFDESVKLIDKYIAEFSVDKYIDDLKWLKAYELRYFIHNYNDLKDIYPDLITQYEEIKLDSIAEEIPKNEWYPNVNKLKSKRGIIKTKEDLENEYEEIKKLLNNAKEIEEELKNENETDKMLTKYKELGIIWRRFYDFDKAAEVYLKGTKELGEDLRGAELIFELANMYMEDARKVIGLPMTPMEYPEAYYDKAQKYYLEVYKSYPKSKEAPKSLEKAAWIYTVIPSGWEKYTPEDRREDRTHYPVYDLFKSAELYEKIWNEYPGYENLKGVLMKMVNTIPEKGIKYFEKSLEIHMELSKRYDMVSLKLIKGLEELVKNSKIYEELYKEEPKLDIAVSVIDLEIKNNELKKFIEKKAKPEGEK